MKWNRNDGPRSRIRRQAIRSKHAYLESALRKDDSFVYGTPAR